MNKKRIKLIFFITVTIAFMLFYINGYYEDRKAQKAFVEEEFHGIIIEIKYFEGRRGFPDLKIDNKWIYMGLNGEKIQNYIKVSDSLAKESGTEIIKVYRKNLKGNWDEKAFK